jgi:tripartite-type tricarboxylate transporter receptor subunit TctC
MLKAVPFAVPARLAALAASALFASAAPPAQAQFYAGKTVNMVINYDAGGNADIQGRIFVKYLPKYISGNPTFIIQNVPGAGGLTAMNLVGQKVGGFKADGMTVGYFTFNGMALLIDDPAIKVKMSDFDFIAGLGGSNVGYIRKEMLSDPTRPATIAQAKNIFAGGYAPSSSHDTRIRMTLEMMGTQFKMVTGFPGAQQVNKAILQNELNYTVSSLPGWASIVVPQLLQPGIVVPVWQYPVHGPNDSFRGNPSLTKLGIPTFIDVYKDAFGKMPSGPLFEAFMLINDLSAKVERAVLMPGGSPKPAVEEMRKAFVAVGKDKDFIEEFERVIKDPPEVTPAEEGQEVLDKLSSIKPEIKATLKHEAGVN